MSRSQTASLHDKLHRFPVGTRRRFAMLLMAATLLTSGAALGSLSGCGGVELSTDSEYQYGPATIAFVYWSGRGGLLNGYYPEVKMKVTCSADCTLLFEPKLEVPRGAAKELRSDLQETQVNLAAGETEYMFWCFGGVGSGVYPTKLTIRVTDLTGQEDPSTVIFAPFPDESWPLEYDTDRDD